MAMLMAGFVLVLLLVPPGRSYPINDDWAYAQSVHDLLNLSYAPHDATQPSSLGALIWGVLTSLVFGYNFTALTLATLVLSASCLLIFYLLLRQLGILPRWAFFAVALLGLNPIYLYLSYTFMTDVAFLAYLSAACLFYVRAMQGHGAMWLWLGGIAAAMSYLTRQIGILVAVALLIYVVWSGSWSLKKAIAGLSIPLVVLVVFMAWQQTQRQPFVALRIASLEAQALSRPLDYVVTHARLLVLMLSAPSLCILPLLRLPRRPLLALPIFLAMAAIQLTDLPVYGTLFPSAGNVITNTGFQLGFYSMDTLWPEWVWTALGITGSLAFSFCLVSCLQGGWTWLRDRTWKRRIDDPAAILYLTGIMLAVATFLLSPFLFDRYVLALFPIVVFVLLRRLAVGIEDGRARAGAGLRWLCLLPIALFGIVGMRDYKEHAAVRWQAAQQLVAQGVPTNHINAGYEWSGWYLYQDGVRLIRATHDYTWIALPFNAVLDPQYEVSDLPRPGYFTVSAIPYHVWLAGGQERHVLLLKQTTAK